MKPLQILMLSCFLAIPGLSYAQKAYEMVQYKGIIKGEIIKLYLADGYLAASKITFGSKNLKDFAPENGATDDMGQLKFLPINKQAQPAKQYFILQKIKGDLEEVPQQISGSFYDGKKNYLFILKKQH